MANVCQIFQKVEHFWKRELQSDRRGMKGKEDSIEEQGSKEGAGAGPDFAGVD